MFDWDYVNISHIARHDVLPHEAEEVIRNNPLFLDQTHEGEEQRYVEVGETQASRILVVVSTLRPEKIRVVTAFPAGKRFLRLYLDHKRSEAHGDTKNP
jgi:uncharacterized DUF497 family protein